MDKTQNISEITEVDVETWSKYMANVMQNETQLPYLFLPIMVLIFVVGFTGNLLTCVVIYYDKAMHTATNFYIFDLAVTDLLVTIAMIMEIYENFNTDHRHYAFGEITCKIHYFLVASLWNNGILIMTALAVERYVAICHPLMLHSLSVWRRMKKIIAILWIVAIAETIPEAWNVRLIQSERASMCFIVPTRFVKMVYGVEAVLVFVLPLSIMIFVYAMIAFQVNVVRKLIEDTTSRNFIHRKNTKKVNKLIIALTVSFIVCWLPFFIIRILIFTWDIKKLSEWWTFWYKFSAVTNWFNAVFNPLLFSLMSTKFRRSLKALWHNTIRGQPPERYSYRKTIVHV